MFEKEAEEWRNSLPYGIDNDTFYNIAIPCMEFGYNKAKVEVEDSYRESLCNSELNLASVTEQLEELEKANKWHKVVDGDLPKENNLYLVAIKDNGLAIAYFNGLHWETKFNLGDFGHCLETVIAWCEIPKFEEK